MQELEAINITHLDTNIQKIDDLFWKLYKKVDIATQKSLEYEIYYFCTDVAKLERIYARNLYKFNSFIDSKFWEERAKQNSDLATTKKLNVDNREAKSLLELQDMVMDRLHKKEETFKRLANFINNERINALAVAKSI